MLGHPTAGSAVIIGAADLFWPAHDFLFRVFRREHK
jgi:hypothetical protein